MTLPESGNEVAMLKRDFETEAILREKSLFIDFWILRPQDRWNWGGYRFPKYGDGINDPALVPA
jgi:hypothetical protein